MSNSYKESINLPKTPFPMKARLPQTEPERLEAWQRNNVYHKMLRSNKNPAFILPDGPPYANGALHIGHVLNKVLKDMILKFKNMSGYRAPFVPGWDCHGLPIELKVSKKKSGLSPAELRQACRNEALKWIEKQKQQFIRLGVLADWQKPYLTMQPQYEAHELRVLAELIDKGLVYRGQKPVHWCPKLRTALSASEVEHREHTSHCVYVKFYAHQKLGTRKAAFVVWTTTPWTLPANRAVCLSPDVEYGIYDIGGECIIMATRLYPELQKHKPEWPADLKPCDLATGEALQQDIELRHPFLNRRVPVILASHVTDDTGTGCVHTAPGHGLDDYNVGLKHNLPIDSPVDERGRYTGDAPEFLQGQSIDAAQQLIVDNMRASGHLIADHKLKHSYPYNPRTNSPMIFRCTQQWFVRLEPGKDTNLRKKALHSLEGLEFVPSWGRQRMQSMLETAPDWCLSRQRVWGVPLPAFYCNDCGEAMLKSEVVRRVADAIESSSTGLEVYHQHEAKHWCQGLKCQRCGASNFKKFHDILDVWFDSGTCHTGVQKSHAELKFPADCYLEGSDQHRGWFFTSLLSSLGAYDVAPYKALITHGFVNDAKGHKMSKSAGNVVDPEEVIRQYGAEILRLWVACEDYGHDIKLSKQTFARVSEAYRRWRNVFRFLLGNLHDFNFQHDKVEFEDMTLIDTWCLLKLDATVLSVRKAYEEYAFHRVYHEVNKFITSDLSALYLDVLKDRLYTAKTTGRKRRSSQTVFYYLLQTLTPMVAPILSFLADEVYEHIQQLPGEAKAGGEGADSGANADSKVEGGVDAGAAGGTVFELEFPKPRGWRDKLSREAKDFFDGNGDWHELIATRNYVLPEIEKQRAQKTIGSSLEARVVITADERQHYIYKKYKDDLKELLIVSQLELHQRPLKVPPLDNSQASSTVEGTRPFDIQITKAEGQKCVRCWHYSTQITKDICPKCVNAL